MSSLIPVVAFFLLPNFAAELKFQNIQAISYQYMNFSSVYSVAINCFKCAYLFISAFSQRRAEGENCPSPQLSWSFLVRRFIRAHQEVTASLFPPSILPSHFGSFECLTPLSDTVNVKLFLVK